MYENKVITSSYSSNSDESFFSTLVMYLLQAERNGSSSNCMIMKNKLPIT